MKFCSLILILFLSSPAMATDFQFESLYESDGFVTERLLPFFILSKTSAAFTIDKVVVEKPCYGMVDLHRANLVHVYCTEATNTDFGVKIQKDGKIYEIRSPVFKVEKVAVISSTPKPIVDNPANALGKQKYSVNCKRCHDARPAILKGVTPAILLNAFAGGKTRGGVSTDLMNAFKGNYFNEAELKSISNYINQDL